MLVPFVMISVWSVGTKRNFIPPIFAQLNYHDYFAPFFATF
jgi:hypothetical protein